MEVHPPEHPIFTWKQFFIHMATVCLGLLIALGLEQSVDALHRQHQRHQLESDLRAEAIHNLHIAIYNLDILENLDHWQTQQVAELDHAATEGRPLLARIDCPQRPSGLSPRPARSTCSRARKHSNSLTLTPLKGSSPMTFSR